MTTVGRDMLAVARAQSERVAKLVMTPAEALGRGEALEAAHTSDAASLTRTAQKLRLRTGR
jgi:hypothetical protein